MQFVPMMWGAPSTLSDTTFLTTVENLISSGSNITYVLAFNEPDGTTATGGSNVDPSVAAELWQSNIEPLKAKGVKLGAPAVTGSTGGFTWLQEFFTACAGNCSADFIPVHWYGDFSGLASHMGQVNGTYVLPSVPTPFSTKLTKGTSYPNMTMWITEYAYDNEPLNTTQEFFQQSQEYFDRLDFVDRYSYFGSYRSSESNVGPNVAMLGANGQTTDIGNWYLGIDKEGVVPTASAAGSVQSSLVVVLLVVGCAAGWLL